MQRALDTYASEVVVDVDVVVAADVTLQSDQTLRFVGGRIVVAGNAAIADAVLRSRSGRNIVLIDPVIDAGATRDGVVAVKLLDVTTARIRGGRLTKANLKLESNDHNRPSATEVTDLTIDMNSLRGTAVYISGICGVAIRNLVCFDGLEGVGIYNNARQITLRAVTSHNHRQDGFLINAGQEITHVDCRAHDNGQSGFTTQRQTAGTDSRRVSWTGCRAWRNGYDGFDIRGATDRPWKIDTGFTLTRCLARDNAECGFYIVKAEGTRLVDCTGILNARQNLFIDTSDRAVATGFRSVSGAARVASGPNKAGILVYNSAEVRLGAPVSGNDKGATQEFGLSFTGGNRNARVFGGDFSRNTAGNRIGGDGAIMLP